MPDHHEYCTGGFSPDDIVITGIAGRFPECKNIGELREALLSNKNFLTSRSVRFPKGVVELPFEATGTLDDIDKFDAVFFGLSKDDADETDPMQRLLLETSYEAIADAGYEALSDFRGANIGVYTAISNDDSKETLLEGEEFTPRHLEGFSRSRKSTQVSSIFDLHGPCYTVDTACSSSFVALWSAYKDIKAGRIDAALVNGCQLCFSSNSMLLYYQSGIVSSTNDSNPFGAKANGFVRTEAIASMFIQKASNARRVYATIMDIKHAANGYVFEGVYVPSYKEEVKLMQDVMRETKLKPSDIQFVETHGTGTQVGDPIEANAVETVFCQDRDTPLLIGSVKSNLGHSEAVAGETGAIKVILAFETGMIPPNQGYETPNPNIPALLSGKMKVVTEPVPLTAHYVPINSFGFGGSVVNAILKKNPIEYSEVPEQEEIPRIILYSATTEAAVKFVFRYIEDHPHLRAEFFALLNKLSFAPTSLKPFRGYGLYQNKQSPVIKIKNLVVVKKREVWFVMSGMGSQWPGMGLGMMKIKIFADSMKKSAAVLKPFGIDLFELLRKNKNHLKDGNVTSAFVAVASIQIALVDMLRALEIEPDGIIGHSIGEVVCAYADGCATAEETILSAYWRGKCLEAAHKEVCAMAAVGLTWEQAVRMCPKGVYPACHNGKTSVTVSGLKKPVQQFVAELRKKNIFACEVNSQGYAFHSEHLWPAAKSLKKALLDVYPNPKPRSKRWLSSSYPPAEWNTPDCKEAGAEYFVHNLMSVVYFYDVLKQIPSNALIIEVGPHFLLHSILKSSIGSDAVYIGLMKMGDENNVSFCLESMGKLYVEGFDPKVEKLYSPVKFPVPRTTPVISDLIKWDHSKIFEIPKWRPSRLGSVRRTFAVQAADAYLLDHFIDGRSLFPATGYVYLAWQALSRKLEKKIEEINVVIEGFKIHRATILSPTNVLFIVTIQNVSGAFEIVQGDNVVASGKIHQVKKVEFCEPEPEVNKDPSSTFVSGEDIYNEIRIHGYQYGPYFRKLMETNLNGREGFVEWDNNWITFMDALLLFYMFSGDGMSSFMLPTGIRSIKIDPKLFRKGVEESLAKKLPGMPVNFHKDTRICRTVGLEIKNLEVDVAPQHPQKDDCTFEEYKFFPYVGTYKPPNNSTTLEEYMLACNKVIDTFGRNERPTPHHDKFTTKSKNDVNLNSYLQEAKAQHQLLLTLKQMYDLKTNDEKQQRKTLFSQYIQNAGNDIVNSLVTSDYCLRYMFNVISENCFKKLSILEIKNKFATLLPTIVEVVEKYSMVKFKSKTLISDAVEEAEKELLNESNIQLCSRNSLANEKKQGVVVSSISICGKEDARQHLHQLCSVVEEKGFILLFHKSSILPPESLLASLSGEPICIIPETVLESWFAEENLVVVSKLSDELGGNLFLLRHAAEQVDRVLIKIADGEKWLNDLKETVCNTSKQAWVVSDDSPNSGIIGMINCLRHEPGGDRIRCIFVPEKSKEKNAPNIGLEDPLLQDVLKKDLLMNVFKEGVWGSFRHFKLDKELEPVEVDYSYLNIKKYGDLSTLTWMESALSVMDVSDSSLVHIYYSALNFRDIMLATGKISKGTVKGVDDFDDCVLGMEFSGRTQNGERVAGMCQTRGIATATKLFPEAFFKIPDDWSMEEAATVPVVYATCFYALMMRANLQQGESILIHSATGGIGQAAIHIARSLNCEIFTTVGTAEKREFLMKTFPFIKKENIGCSRDTTFENMVMKRTNGRGVDVVLNSLADDKFLASIRCVAIHGRFLEIGKYDLSLDHTIGLKCMLKNIEFHGVMLDQVMKDFCLSSLKQITVLLREGIKNGVVKPLNRTVFQLDEVEKAFRYMGRGVHMGKLLIKIRDEENEKLALPKLLRLSATPITYFYPYKVYVVIGGLGGFGIEVTKWLLSRGAKKLVLTSRYGARTPYHQLCLRRWKDAGYDIRVSTKNVSYKDEAAALLREIKEIGPVGGIFNSAVVLHDAFLENTNWEDFKEVCAPKADATKYLDVLSRSLCPQLDHFVCFSSISCGRGNAGQMNYGYANSVMERVCEQRRADGLPGLAIQWGVIGEVGVVHRHMGDDAMIAGVGAQKVKSCLEIIDASCQLKKPVVSSYVIKESRSKQGDQGDVLQHLARIFGLKDSSEFNLMRSFGEMGADSMIGVEVKTLLESAFDVTFTMQEIQEMKFGDVKALQEKVDSEKSEKAASSNLVSTVFCTSLPTSCLHSQSLECLNRVQNGVPVFIVDIDDNNTSVLRKLSENISQPVYGLLLSKETPTKDLESLASWFLKRVSEITQKEIHIVALSSASAVAIEMCHQIQKSGENRLQTLSLINGYSSILKILNKEKSSYVDLLCDFVENYIPSSRKRIEDQLSNASTLEQIVRCVVELFSKSSKEQVDRTELTEIITPYVQMAQLLGKYTPKEKLSKDILVIEDSYNLLANDVVEAKMLFSEIFSAKINIQRIPDISSLNEESIQRLNSALKSAFSLDI